MRDFGDDIFSGTAKYYAKYRPPYPQQLFSDIVKKFKLDGKGMLLDLGCGTGELAIPLANYFEKTLAIDPDSAMLDEGRKKIKRLKIKNIEWQKGSSRTLTEVEGAFKLITMGQSFHWMDQERVLGHLYKIVEKDGGVIIIGSEPTEQDSLVNHKNRLIKELITKYLGLERRAGNKIYTHPPKKYGELLPESKFGNFEERFYEIELSRTADEIIGQLFSMSWASKKLLGEQAFEFENELRQKLTNISTSQKFIERTKFSTYILIK